ncbi:hypothetical protein STRIP9103_04990 [Streptomyces ipomoeae 91-03]|uniref:Uncharacterized protein n=1 Tax=Streptomyces ipomoeae 91-03 TaxID=698759 RepID=L1KQX3_9ACTN|nr:hypothetical protein STRIP9103_04990 [Streptomyces ipomoeae 91-03]
MEVVKSGHGQLGRGWAELVKSLLLPAVAEQEIPHVPQMCDGRVLYVWT